MDHCEGPTLLLFEDIDLIGNALNGQDSKTSHNLRVISQLRTLLDEFGKISSLITGTVYSFLVCHFPNPKKYFLAYSAKTANPRPFSYPKECNSFWVH